jgi:hypothetical protein
VIFLKLERIFEKYRENSVNIGSLPFISGAISMKRSDYYVPLFR